MPASDSPAVLVARFLKDNGYRETLPVFLAESGVPLDVVERPGGFTIEDVLEERKLFELASRFGKVGVSGGEGEEGGEVAGWAVPAPSIPTRIETLSAPTANILHISLLHLLSTTSATTTTPTLLLTRAPSQMHLLSPNEPHHPFPATNNHPFTPHDSPVLATALLRNRWLLSTSMSGQLAVSDLVGGGGVVGRRHDHRKFAVGIAVRDGGEGEGVWVATAGWDGRVFVYCMEFTGEDVGAGEQRQPVLNPPLNNINLPSNPLSLLFIPHPTSATNTPLLLLSRTDSTLLYYYTILPTPALLGTQPLTPHTNSTSAFSPSAIGLRPPIAKDISSAPIVAVATSHVPYQKLIIARLLIPPPQTATATATPIPSATVAELASAILLHVTTHSPQSPYSTPQLAWRPEGNGIWVSGDDGVIRGIDVVTGKVAAALGGAHEEGARIRALWAGCVDGEERMVSGGFDGRAVVWRCA
ncbi:MAG: hypothetical protein M1813_001508 [Trichoglossum hirsutum]|nr:MAG: hypothetical protein M1813_001508 [Trichoglossum hirsutum]